MTAKIMLVEDDTNLSDIYKARFEAEGFQVTAAKDGEEALALAVQERPDLIISDIMMPKISGFEMLDILRGTESIKATKVIMMTALGQAEDKARAEKLGADRYLVKSQVTLEDVVKAVHEVLSAPAQTPPALQPKVSDQPTTTTSPPTNISTATPPTSPSSAVTAKSNIVADTQLQIADDGTLTASAAPTNSTTTSIPVDIKPSETISIRPATISTPTSNSQSSSSNPSNTPILPTKTIEELEAASQAAAQSDGALGKPEPPTSEAPPEPAALTTTPHIEPSSEPETTASASTSQSAALDQIHDFVDQTEAKSQVKAAEDNAAKKAIETSEPLTVSQPAEAKMGESITDNVSIANKKIIKPVTNGISKFELEKALAIEESNEAIEKNQVQTQQPVVSGKGMKAPPFTPLTNLTSLAAQEPPTGPETLPASGSTISPNNTI